MLDIMLSYEADGASRIRGLRRVSKQSRRIYAGSQELRPSRRSARGIRIVSTSRGVMSSPDARKARIGGEVLCEVW